MANTGQPPRRPGTERARSGAQRRRERARSAPPPAAAPGQPLVPQRVQKLLADAGLGSRREIERWIVEGRLTLDGLPVTLGMRALPTAGFALDGAPLRVRARDEVKRRAIAYHKPLGELTTRHDPEGRATVFEKLPRLRGSRWIAVGRLDFNTSGLLLFTNDGVLANALMHPKHELEREYAVRVSGAVAPGALAKLSAGVVLDDGPARFEKFEDGGGEGVNRWYRVVIKEGRNREVRRMFEAVGATVSRLMRVRYGPIALDAWLKRGMVRELTGEEVDALLGAAGTPPARAAAPVARTSVEPQSSRWVTKPPASAVKPAAKPAAKPSKKRALLPSQRPHKARPVQDGPNRGPPKRPAKPGVHRTPRR